MRFVQIPGNMYIDADHIGLITLKDVDHGQTEVRIFLRDRTDTGSFYADRKEILKFIEEHKLIQIHAAPAYVGRPE